MELLGTNFHDGPGSLTGSGRRVRTPDKRRRPDSGISSYTGKTDGLFRSWSLLRTISQGRTSKSTGNIVTANTGLRRKIFGRDSWLYPRILSRAHFSAITTREKKGERGTDQVTVIERVTGSWLVDSVEPDFSSPWWMCAPPWHPTHIQWVYLRIQMYVDIILESGYILVDTLGEGGYTCVHMYKHTVGYYVGVFYCHLKLIVDQVPRLYNLPSKS